MAVKTVAGFKRLAIIAIALLGFLVIGKWDAQAEPYRSGFKASDQVSRFNAGGWGFDTTSNPSRVTVAQNETQTATNEKNASSATSNEPESKADEKKESTGVEKKPLKDFQPSERIEAEQAVDFPYDI